MAGLKAPKLNSHFALLCFSSFLFFMSFNMVIPELYDHLTSLGGEDYKGFVIPSFAFIALVSRPVSGWITDHIGRIPVMMIGAVVCVISCVMYNAVGTVLAFFVLRFFHGFSTGFQPTGTSAYIGDIVPFKSRGVSMGYYGFFTSMGMAGGPALGSEITQRFSLETMFYVSAAIAFLSMVVLFGMKETLPKSKRQSLWKMRLRKEDIIEPRVFPPALIMALALVAFGTVLTLVPDQSKALGIQNKGIYFTILMATSFFVRIVAGRISDIYGRERVLRFGLTLLTIGMVLGAFSHVKEIFYLSAVIYGLSIGVNSPTIFAWAIDRGHENHRGRAMATLYIALELGIIVGGILAGLIYDNDVSRIPYAFWLCALCSFAALMYSIFRPKEEVPA